MDLQADAHLRRGLHRPGHARALERQRRPVPTVHVPPLREGQGTPSRGAGADGAHAGRGGDAVSMRCVAFAVPERAGEGGGGDGDCGGVWGGKEWCRSRAA